jgi:hypothetical protein
MAYREQNDYFFEQETSGAERNPYVDQIVNINPSYIKVLQLVGNEEQLPPALIGAQFGVGVETLIVVLIFILVHHEYYATGLHSSCGE